MAQRCLGSAEVMFPFREGALASSPKSRSAMRGRQDSTDREQPGKGQHDNLTDSGTRSPETVSADLSISQRDLPHWQVGGATYFVTFRLKGYSGSEASGTGVSPVEPAVCPPAGCRIHQHTEATPPPLTPAERTIVMKAILFWHDRRWSVDALTVMPDHVHVLAMPLERSPGHWFSLAGLMHSVKSFTAHRIQHYRRASGALWQSERYDRVNRDEHEFYQKATYILENAQRKGLIEYGWEYEWFWCPGKEQLGNRVRRG